jgi:hypothetical protein
LSRKRCHDHFGFLPKLTFSVSAAQIAVNKTPAQQFMPVNSLFSTEYVTAAVCSSLPQFLFQQAKDVSLQTNIEGPHILLAVLIFSSLPNENKTTSSTEIGRLHSDLKSLISKVLIVNCATRAPSITTLSQTSGRRSNSMDLGYSENDCWVWGWC